MKKNPWYMIYYITIEVIFGSLLFAPYFILQGEKIPFLFYFLLTLPAAYLFVFLIHKYQEKSSMLFFISVFPLLLVMGTLTGISIFITLSIAILIFWRTNNISSELDNRKTGFWLFLTFMIGFVILVFAKINSYPELNFFMIIMIIQLSVILIGRFMINWSSIQASKTEKMEMLRYFLLIIFGIGGVSLLLVPTMNLIRWIFTFLYNLLVLAVSYLLSPIFNWTEDHKLKKDFSDLLPANNLETESEEDNLGLIHDNTGQNSVSDFDPNILLIILFAIAFIIVFIFLYKKFRGSTDEIVSNDPVFSFSSSYDDRKKADGFAQNKSFGSQPSYRIRKEIYRLEQQAEKLKLGRTASETIGEWFSRIGAEEDELILSTYEKVRYGNLLESDEEYQLFKSNIEKKKLEIKQLHKQMVEEGKIESTSILKRFKRN